MQSVNVIHHINKLKNKYHMIISMKKVKVLVILLCLTVCNLMDYTASQSPL